MDEENNNLGNISSSENESNISLSSSGSPFPESFYFSDVYDEKKLKNFIKRTERLIRSSREYNFYISELRSSCPALNSDNILSNINSADASIEFHHYPFTLYDITEIVLFDHFFNKVKFSSFSLAKEIMDLHYANLIGLVPLTTTTHELAHDGSLFLAKSQIFGQYDEFMKLYPKGLSKELKLKVQQMEENSKGNNIISDFKGLF